ncbi:MAG: hypothetical protein KKA67_05050 [Spirochaetes bacterium]|nr:hypothetical protein [Spirochaetota bacterium]MBU1080308.1 hypothetical protein [Spirochaetota bacterium]
MKALIVHYHLKPGGVTTVIRRQLSSLAVMGIDAAVLSGEAPRDFRGAVSVEPALAYDGPGSGLEPDPRRVDAIVAAIRREADALGDDAVVHAHNPTIRKNSSMLAALSELAASGRRIVMHVHDLAEDWRPGVYSSQPYPEGVTWAAINRFDASALLEAGAGRVEYLPDPVARIPGPEPGGRGPAVAPAGPGLVLFPVRGIRRKNLGEALLLSMFVRPGSRVGVTLPPTSPKDVPYYDSWRGLAAELRAPIGFGVGLERGLDELYSEARAALTTSVKEGFGMSFLEPALRGRVTLGRRLPRVVSDFESEGLVFPALYGSIAAASGLFDEDAFARRVRAVVESALEAYGRSAGGFAAKVAEDVLGSGTADFGRLDEPAQAQALRALASDRRARAAFAEANPFLEGWDAAADGMRPPSTEALEPWSESLYGRRLSDLYRGVLESGGGAAPEKEALLNLYLRPEAFYGVGV